MQIKNKILSFLVSFVFIPLALIGQALGIFIGEYISVIYENWGTAAFIVSLIPYIIGGVLGGYISAVVAKKIYKNIIFNYALILPILVITAALLGNFIGGFNFKEFLSNFLLIASYFYVLKEKYIQ